MSRIFDYLNLISDLTTDPWKKHYICNAKHRKIQSKDLYSYHFSKLHHCIVLIIIVLKIWEIEGALEVPLWSKYGAIPTIIPEVTAF